MIPNKVGQWLEEQGRGKIVGERPVGGGCINNGAQLQTEDGATFFLKTNTSAPEDMFAREAEGLAALRETPGPRLPEAYIWAEEFILLEDMEPALRAGDYWENLGREIGRDAFLYQPEIWL